MIPNASPTVAVFTVNLGVEDFGAVMDRGFVMRNAGRLSGRNPGEQPATSNVANAAPTDFGHRIERTLGADSRREDLRRIVIFSPLQAWIGQRRSLDLGAVRSQ